MNDNNLLIKQLVDEMKCDSNLASMLLRFTGWDIEGAKRILEAVPKDIFILKAKFITQLTGYYGAFFFSYDEKEKAIKRILTVISDDKEIGRIDIEKNWKAFESELCNYAKTKKVDGVKIDQFNKRINARDFKEKISNVLKNGKKVNNEALNNILIDELYNNFMDTNIALKYDIEMENVFEVNKAQNVEGIDYEGNAIETEDIDKELENRRAKKKDKSLIVLKVDPVLSPVNGVSINGLEFGDRIQVRITDERDIADYLAELLGGKVGSIRIPIFTKIVEIKHLESDNIVVLTHFGPGIMGMFKVLSDVKLVTDERTEGKKEAAGKKKSDKSLPFIIGGIIIIIIILIIMIFLLH